MQSTTHKLLLADDDIDDCIFFREALDESPISYTLSTAKDGMELMRLLETRKDQLPDMLFLDLNMPRKTGYECLKEIKDNGSFKDIPVIIISTSYDHEMADLLYAKGANYNIFKPPNFLKLKKSIKQLIDLFAFAGKIRPPRKSFVLKIT